MGPLGRTIINMQCKLNTPSIADGNGCSDVFLYSEVPNKGAGMLSSVFSLKLVLFY